VGVNEKNVLKSPRLDDLDIKPSTNYIKDEKLDQSLRKGACACKCNIF